MDGRNITFENGSVAEDIDVILCCTGYKIENKFLNKDLMPVTEVSNYICFISIFTCCNPPRFRSLFIKNLNAFNINVYNLCDHLSFNFV